MFTWTVSTCCYPYSWFFCSSDFSVLGFSVLFCFAVLIYFYSWFFWFFNSWVFWGVFFCADDEFAINSEILLISSILFIYLNIRLKIRWIYSNCLFFYLKMVSWKRIPRCYKDVYVNGFFPRIALKFTNRLWKYLPIECYPLTYDLNGFKSRISWHHFTVDYF